MGTCITLGSSPRLLRPAPIVLPRRLIDSIKEEEDELQGAEERFLERVRANQDALALAPIQANPITSAIKEIVKLRRFSDPLLEIPAPLIDKKLYLGDSTHAMDIPTLKELGITAILNCASSAVLTDAEYYDESFAYYEFAAEDRGDYEMASHIAEARSFFTRCMEEGRAVLVHCAAGINRSAFIAVYLYMVMTGTPLVEAVEHCFALRPIILCNEGFIDQLVEMAEEEGRI
jgi:protein-tyrosine phosphatase